MLSLVLVVLKEQISVLGLEGQVLGPVLGLEGAVLAKEYTKDQSQRLGNFQPIRFHSSNTCHKFAAIKPLLSCVLYSPATSAPMEHAFSHSGIMMRLHRARMSNCLLETLVFPKCKGSLLVILLVLTVDY